jgi:hypothetical protein
MINHARTLLANVAVGGLTNPLEEYISANFVPLAPEIIPGWLTSLRKVLFGSDPDRDYLMHRVRDLLAVVYSAGYQESLQENDKRITHSDGADNLAYPPQLQISQYVGATPSVPAILGGYDAADAGSRVSYRFKVIVNPGGTAFQVLRIVPKPPGDGAWNAAGTMVPLRGTGVSVTKHAPLIANDSWNLDISLQPRKALASIVAELEALGDVALAPLLVTGGGDVEPLKTYRLLWQQGKDNTRRLAGITLAVIWHMERIRRSRDGNH